MCIALDKKSDSLFQRSRTLVFESLDATASILSAAPPVDLMDDSFIYHFIVKPELIIDDIPEEDNVKLKAHAV